MSKTIKVEIKVKQEITYYHEAEVTEEEYNKLKELDGEDIMNYDTRYYDVERVVDTSSVYDDGGEWLDFQIKKVED